MSSKPDDENSSNAPAGSPELRFTIVLRRQPDGTNQLTCVPQAVNMPLSPADCIAMCAEAIKWCLQQQAQLIAQEQEQRVWRPGMPGAPRVRLQ